MLNSLEGKRGEIRAKPPIPALVGLFGRPTLVHNLLTLASVPMIATDGGAAYAEHGVGRSRGTQVFQLAGNIARGGIVDEDALYEALKERRMAGAALDCFAVEPVVQPHRFGELENVLLAPHSIAWTDELFRDIGRSVCQGMVDLSLGRRPRGVVNPDVFQKASFQAKWKRITGVVEVA